MNRNSEQKNKNNLITKDSLRPTCTRSKTPCLAPTPKENPTSQAEELLDASEPLNIPVPKKTRCRRQWEQWSWEEKKCFFEGLAEFGKDYSKIETYMNKKLKLKSYGGGKTKEQIRFFYHRTWSKISKKLGLEHEDDSKKACRRELHYLLCLGVLRKKRSAGFGAKVMRQLHELATKGLTYVRRNGRNLRLRPPNRFLRRIYSEITDNPQITFPKTVTVEFLPNSNVSFNFVQKHAFNPRIRFTGVNINAKFSEVFDMFNKRFTDLYTNEKLKLCIHPIQSDLIPSEFTKVLANAENLLKDHEKTQDTNIVVEPKNIEDDDDDDDEDQLIVEEESQNERKQDLDLHQILPNILAMHGKNETTGTERNTVEETSSENGKNFPGYWNYEDAKNVYMRTLFVAFDQKQTLKFKYEWKTSMEKNSSNSSFTSTSLQCLVRLCGPQKTALTPTATNLKIHSPSIIYEQKPVVPGINSKHQQNELLSPSGLVLPFRPRPGRKRTITQRSSGTTSPIVPNPNTTKSSANKYYFKNAVAVNLIPQQPQLIQFAHLTPESTKLVNSGSATASKETLKEEVIDEGFQEHFQSLANIIQSSALVKEGNQHLVIQTTPKKVNPIKKNIPASPNLEWLNDTVDISLTSFLNVCDMQALQNRNSLNTAESRSNTSKLPTHSLPNNNVKTTGHMLDPTLPKFESGETSQGPLYDLSFELSNQHAKSKDHFKTA